MPGLNSILVEVRVAGHPEDSPIKRVLDDLAGVAGAVARENHDLDVDSVEARFLPEYEDHIAEAVLTRNARYVEIDAFVAAIEATDTLAIEHTEDGSYSVFRDRDGMKEADEPDEAEPR